MIRYLSVIFLLAIPLCACAQWDFIHDFYVDTNGVNKNALQYPDKDRIIVAGHAQAKGLDRKLHIYLSLLDYNGNLYNTRHLYFPGKYNVITVGESEDASCNTLAKVSDNKYVLVANEWDYKTNPSIMVHQPFLYFFDADLDSTRFIKYTDPVISRIPYSVCVDDQKSVLVAGMETSKSIHDDGGYNIWDSSYVWLAKYDSNGNTVWNKRLYPRHNFQNKQDCISSIAYKVIQGTDSYYYLIITGWDTQYKIYNQKLVKVDGDGNVVWDKFLPKNKASWGRANITACKDGTIAFITNIGNDDTSSTGVSDTYLMYGKYNEAGDTLWTRKYRKMQCTHEGKNVVEAENGDLIIYALVYYDGYYHNTVIRTTPKGNIKWYREYAYKSATNQQLLSRSVTMSYTPTRQVLLSGQVLAPNVIPGVVDSTGVYSWFALTDTFGCMSHGCEAGDTIWWTTDVQTVRESPVEIMVYPNPVQDMLHVKTGISSHPLQANLVDMRGRILYSGNLLSAHTQQIDMVHFPSGIYMLEIWEEGRRIKVEKVIR